MKMNNNESTLVANESAVHQSQSNHKSSLTDSFANSVTSEPDKLIDKIESENNHTNGNSVNEENDNSVLSNQATDNKNDDESVKNVECSINKSNDDTIQKLGLNLDYQSHTNSSIEQLNYSAASLTVQRSETSSIHSSNSQTNSPPRSSSYYSLPFLPKKLNISESSLFINHDHLYHLEHARFFEIERKNLMHLSSLIINNLINNISPLTKTLECHDNIFLYDFFSIIELILKHGLKARKGIIFGRKELWSLIESIENINPQIIEIVQNIRELPNVKTNNGRVKAFLRLTFVHKVFNEIFPYLFGCKELLVSFYEEGAFILSDEIEQLLSKTEQLKDFDFRWCAKDDQLDELSNLIDLTNYLVNKERTTQEIVYKVNINENQLNELMEEKKFYEGKSKVFRDKIIFYYNRVKELGIESLFEAELIRSPSKIELLTKKLSEIFKVPVEKLISIEPNPDILSLQEDIATLKKQLEIELSNRLSKDAALEYIEQDFLVEQDENIVMRHQIEEVKQVNDLCAQKVDELTQLNQDLNGKIVTLTNKNQQLVSNVTELQRSLVATEAKYNQLSTSEKLLRKQFEELQRSNEQLKVKALEEQEEKKNLKKKLDDNIERNSMVINELNIANHRANDYPSLKKKHDILKRRCLEYEQTCEEIGQKLATAQLEIENLKEQTIPYSECVWKDDTKVNKCEECEVQFTIKLRKHHCRNCGGIFCQKCSDRKIPLPADSKPCRVCDQCFKKLMSRYNG